MTPLLIYGCVLVGLIILFLYNSENVNDPAIAFRRRFGKIEKRRLKPGRHIVIPFPPMNDRLIFVPSEDIISFVIALDWVVTNNVPIQLKVTLQLTLWKEEGSKYTSADAAYDFLTFIKVPSGGSLMGYIDETGDYVPGALDIEFENMVHHAAEIVAKDHKPEQITSSSTAHSLLVNQIQKEVNSAIRKFGRVRVLVKDVSDKYEVEREKLRRDARVAAETLQIETDAELTRRLAIREQLGEEYVQFDAIGGMLKEARNVRLNLFGDTILGSIGTIAKLRNLQNDGDD